VASRKTEDLAVIKIEKIEDIYLYIHFIFKCGICGQYFPTWWVSPAEWEMGGFGNRRIVCKKCFEKRVPLPNYYTIEEYMAERVHADTEEGKEEARAILNEIWDMPAEYEALGLLEGLTEEEQETTREELKRLSWEIHGR